MHSRIKSRNSEDELRRVFRVYDENNTGKIDFEDLKRVSQDMKANLSDEEIKGMIFEADIDKDNAVSVDEFLRVMKKAKLM